MIERYSVRDIFTKTNRNKIKNSLKKVANKDSVFVFIGTSKSILDSLGPMTGSKLKKKCPNLLIFGTTEENMHALSIEKFRHEINCCYPDRTIIALDACLGDITDTGRVSFRNFGICPGRGVGKNIDEIGHYSIVATTCYRENQLYDKNAAAYEDFIDAYSTILSDIIEECVR